jgi:hypothetical protein
MANEKALELSNIGGSSEGGTPNQYSRVEELDAIPHDNSGYLDTIRISRRFSSAREFQMGNFQKYCSQNVGQDFIVLDFLLGRYRAGGEGVRGRLISPAKNDTHIYHSVTTVLPKKTGTHRICLQSLNAAKLVFINI